MGHSWAPNRPRAFRLLPRALETHLRLRLLAPVRTQRRMNTGSFSLEWEISSCGELLKKEKEKNPSPPHNCPLSNPSG